jgi:DNA-directed RNA polymerase sigma subunit (sigma70/sigma32)
MRELGGIHMDFDKIYLEEVEKYKPLKYHQELLIYLSKRSYQAAKEKLVQAKQELVISIAIDYLLVGLPFMELINSGNMGLTHGIDQIKDFDDGDLNDYLKPFIMASIDNVISKGNSENC